jgi:drug/metabolite transporter (DMT)-like permease
MQNPTKTSRWRIVLFTVFALCAFAANSVLNRLALGSHLIDPTSYITIRLLSGAVALWLLNSISKHKLSLPRPLSLWPAFYLFLYGITFSFAYQSLSSGMGAFILFGTVQTTMLSTVFLKGERPHWAEWLGLAVALAGLAYLLFPGLSAPNLLGALLMITAGVAWAFYTLKGKGVEDPLQTTALNFVLAVPMVLIANLFSFSTSYFSSEGVLYAVISGSLSSGVGYAVWYAALRGLTNTRAALLQLCVPIIAALGGVVFLSETITTRLVWAGLLIVSGIGFALSFGKIVLKK